MEVLDNVNRFVGDDLKRSITPGAKVAIAASSFSIYAYEALKQELEQVECLQFIFTTPTFVPSEVTDKAKRELREFHIPQLATEKGFFGTDFELRLKNKLTQRAIAKECADWIRRKAHFRSNRTGAPMQQFACVKSSEREAVYMPLHGFTAVDLGYQQGNAVSNIVNRMDEPVAKVLTRYLIKHDYTDTDDKITAAYHEAKQSGTIAPLPPELAAYAEHIFRLVDSVYSKDQLPEIENGRVQQGNPLNANFDKKAFRELWSRIHQKAVYSVHFETEELIAKCVATLDAELKVAPLQYVVERGQQTKETSYEALKAGDAFDLAETKTERLTSSVYSTVQYDLIGKLAEETTLTRATIGAILQKIKPSAFELYRVNPEDFLRVASRLVNEQKATVIVEHLAYSATDETYGINIFTQQPKQDLSKGVKANHHIYDYVFTDSQIERNFLEELDAGTDIEVYAKLPKSFSIPTPVGSYTPDWAIAFKQGSVKHIYFVAETKGSMSSMEMREIEKSKIKCARKFFAKITSDQVKYEVVPSYSKLMELVH